MEAGTRRGATRVLPWRVAATPPPSARPSSTNGTAPRRARSALRRCASGCASWARRGSTRHRQRPTMSPRTPTAHRRWRMTTAAVRARQRRRAAAALPRWAETRRPHAVASTAAEATTIRRHAARARALRTARRTLSRCSPSSRRSRSSSLSSCGTRRASQTSFASGRAAAAPSARATFGAPCSRWAWSPATRATCTRSTRCSEIRRRPAVARATVAVRATVPTALTARAAARQVARGISTSLRSTGGWPRTTQRPHVTRLMSRGRGGWQRRRGGTRRRSWQRS
mmetsp:Transcript_29315/g.80352  ORF Transcript_29315/g.80352 Transcript_29315/m.80352 type:complete len:284 (-) Transcript_29315:669-1520(-)